MNRVVLLVPPSAHEKQPRSSWIVCSTLPPSRTRTHVGSFSKTFSPSVRLGFAAGHGIVISGLSDCFHTAPAQPGLLIGFGAVSTTGLPTVLRMLDRVLASQSPGLAS